MDVCLQEQSINDLRDFIRENQKSYLSIGWFDVVVLEPGIGAVALCIQPGLFDLPVAALLLMDLLSLLLSPVLLFCAS